MDFAAPPPVIEALRRRVDHGVFGYNLPTASQVDAVVGYLDRHFDWRIDPDWIVWLPGLVSGLNIACRAVGDAGDAVFTATPIYPPFLSAPGNSARRAVSAPLVRDSAGWLWDFPTVDAVLRDQPGETFPAVPSAQPDRARVERGRVVADRAAGRKARSGGVFGRNPQRSDSVAVSPAPTFCHAQPRTGGAHHYADGALQDLQHSRAGLRLCHHSGQPAAAEFPSCHAMALCRMSMPWAWRRPRRP